jgi:hypothetical protein
MRPVSVGIEAGHLLAPAEARSDRPRSLGLEACEFDDFCPLFGFRGNERSEVGGGIGDTCSAPDDLTVRTVSNGI